MSDTSKKIIIQFDKPIVQNSIAGNETAFIVSGQQYDMIGGTLINKTYTVLTTQASLLGENFIELLIDPYKRFNNVEGQITVTYEQEFGSLAGIDGPVVGFSEVFTPTELIGTPNPWIKEYINAKPNINAILHYITKKTNDSSVDYLNACPTLAIIITRVANNIP